MKVVILEAYKDTAIMKYNKKNILPVLDTINGLLSLPIFSKY